MLAGVTPSHPDDHGSRQQGVGQPSDAGQGDRRVRWQLLQGHIVAAHDAAAGGCAATVAGVEQTTNVFVILRFRAKHGIDFVEQDRRPVIGTDLAEQVGRRHVHGRDRVRHKQLGDLKGPGLAARGLGGQKGQPRGRVPCIHQMSMSDPERMGHLGMLGWVTDKATEEVVHRPDRAFTVPRVKCQDMSIQMIV